MTATKKCRILLTSDLHRGFSKNTHLVHAKFLKEVQALEWDILVCAGDLGSSKKEHYRSCLRFLRQVAGDKPVLIVRGNHDYWDRKVAQAGTYGAWDSLRGYMREKENQYKVTYLPVSGPWLSPDGRVLILGWDGWYVGDRPPYTNDMNFMPVGSHGTLKNIEELQLKQIGTGPYEAKVVIGVTHMPMLLEPFIMGIRKMRPEYNADPKVFDDYVKGQMHHLLVGHTHHRVEGVEFQGTKIWNAGSDYNEPKYLIVEV